MINNSYANSQSVPGRCYGCSSAATDHCVTLLKALAMKASTRNTLIKEVTYCIFVRIRMTSNTYDGDDNLWKYLFFLVF